MANGFKQSQVQTQSQKQVQRMSQRQIQAVTFLGMGTRDLKDEIYKFASENPALEIVSKENVSLASVEKSANYEKYLESQEDYEETLQQHLMDQLKLDKRISEDEFKVCQALIYNLDKDGFYGSMLAPETLLDKNRPQQNAVMLAKCMDIVQRLDPIGTCCKNIEESLFIQAKIIGGASELTLFILNGHFDLLNPPIPENVLRNLQEFQKKWHQKKFAPQILLDKHKYDEEDVEDAIFYIRNLNPHPAGNYISDISGAEYNRPDIVLSVEKIKGFIAGDDFSTGKVLGNNGDYFQIKYASGDLPEVRLAEGFSFDKDSIEKAKEFIANLQYRESSIVLQGCAIVKNQLDFFEYGPGNLKVLTRRQIAKMLGIHESTVSRMSAKKNSKYIQTKWGLFSCSYFFSSGVDSSDGGEKVSSEVIQEKIKEILDSSKDEKVSDLKLTEILNQQGIKIARRTVAKYRSKIGLQNSYNRGKL